MKLDILFHYNIDESTGEITYIGKEEIKIDTLKSSSTNHPKSVTSISIEQNSDPILTLDDTKCYLNLAAISLMGTNSEDRIDIKYENGRPIIGTDSAFGSKGGNKLSKSNTFACRGNKNTELSKHGREFKLIPHPNKPGLFILDSGNTTEQEVRDDNIRIEEGDDVLDLNLDEFVDTKDANIVEIDSDFFKL